MYYRSLCLTREGEKRRVNPHTIILSNGEYFNFNSSDFATYDIEVIAHSLSMLCRFTGHCNTFYSVAEHSVYVSHLVPEADALYGLLHDAVEAFVGDMASPLKSLIPEYTVIEQKIQGDLFSQFGLKPFIPHSVKEADLLMLRTEQKHLFNNDDIWSPCEGLEPVSLNDLKVEELGLSPKDAKRLFLDRFYELR